MTRFRLMMVEVSPSKIRVWPDGAPYPFQAECTNPTKRPSVRVEGNTLRIFAEPRP